MVNHHRRRARLDADQVFRRLDRPHRQGRVAQAKPPRPQGVERNVVVTTWDWADDKQYLHDLISTDKRNPTVNAYGPLFGSPEYATDIIPILDPVKNSVTNFHAPVRDADMPLSLGPGHAAALKPLAPSAYWGNEQIWDTHINNHNSMIDEKGRLWLAAAVRGVKDPAFCEKGSDHPSAKVFPLEAEPAAAGDARSEDDEIHLRRHLLHHPPSAVRLRRQQHAVDSAAAAAAWSAGSTPRCSTRPATRRNRRAGPRSSSTPTATASATNTPSPASRSIPTRTCASARCSTR